MKKIVAIFLIPVFLFMTAGVAITSLYCNGEISDIGINVQSCCKEVNKGGCCDTKTKVVKVEDTFVNHSSSIEFNKLIELYLPSFQNLSISRFITISYPKTNWGNAPPFHNTDLYIVFRTLII